MRRTMSAAAVAMIVIVAFFLAVVGGDDPAPPDRAYKLMCIHHSCGENWLADGDGGLGRAPAGQGNYVSDTNYGRGPVCEDCWGAIGDCTDIAHGGVWFGVPDGEPFAALLHTFDQYADYRRGTAPDPNPNRESEIIVFKSCYPDSNLAGLPDDPPSEDEEGLTVSRAQAVYFRLLESFAACPDKLFVAITAPPVARCDRWKDPGSARAFNNRLVREWLADHPDDHVAVFDFYNVLTSNGGDPHANDLGSETGNHHRRWNGALQHLQTEDRHLAAYASGDSHPTAAGNRMATAEFVPLHNVFVHRWEDG